MHRKTLLGILIAIQLICIICLMFPTTILSTPVSVKPLSTQIFNESTRTTTSRPVLKAVPTTNKSTTISAPKVSTDRKKTNDSLIPSSRSLKSTPKSTTPQPYRQASSRKLSDSSSLQTNVVKKPKIDFSNLFREEVDHYPEDEISHILKQTPHELKELFNVLNTPLDPNINLTERVASSNDDYEREESVCRTVMRNIYPREANKDNSLVYIPNNQEFMQVIQAELCQHPEDECNYLKDNLPYGMTSVCQQKYAYKKLLYLDPLEKRMASDLFRYPSCCSCYIRHGSIDLRSNAAHNTSDVTALSSPTRDIKLEGSIRPLARGSSSKPTFELETSLLNADSLLPPLDDKANDNGSLGGNTTASSPSSSSETESKTKEERRQPKSVALDTTITTNANFSSSEGRHRRIKGSVDGATESNSTEEPATNQTARSQTPAGKRKNTRIQSHTVVLQEDKVYKPNNESP